MRKSFIALTFLLVPVCLSAQLENKVYLRRAGSSLQQVLSLYEVKKYGLLMETYPRNPNQQITYTVNTGSEVTQQEVSFLWPHLAMVLGRVSLYKTSDDKKYRKLMGEQARPGLDLYRDTTRQPGCYQSYPTFAGQNDRYYDDNDWVAIDFCSCYTATKSKEYLKKAIALHNYIYSGWSDDPGGGIYWCGQKKGSENTCSNAPAAVLCMRFYRLTKEEKYLNQTEATYQWTRDNLRNPSDFVYWDNKNLQGKIGYAKYTYNSGQMIQAGILLYQTTGDEQYLKDAQQTAGDACRHFLKLRPMVKGGMKFFPSGPWFNVILFRGLKALYEADKNSTYVKAMIDNTGYAWQYTRDENGLLNNDQPGNRKDKFKSLLENSCMIELYSEISGL